MGLFSKKKKIPDELMEKWFGIEQGFMEPFVLSATLLDGTLDDEGIDAKQKATFNGLIILGALQQLNIRIFDKEIPDRLLLGTLHSHLKEPPFNLDHNTANVAIHRLRNRLAGEAYGALWLIGLRRIDEVADAFRSEVGVSEKVFKAWAVDKIYEDTELIENFKKEYKSF